MKHAFVIGGDGPATEALEDRLWESGYHSIVRVADERQAWTMAETVRPDVIVLGGERLESVPLERLSRLSEATGASLVIAAPRGARMAAGLPLAVACEAGLHALSFSARVAQAMGHLPRAA